MDILINVSSDIRISSDLGLFSGQMDKNHLARNNTEKENESGYSVKLFDSILWNIAFDCALCISHLIVSGLCIIR